MENKNDEGRLQPMWRTLVDLFYKEQACARDIVLAHSAAVATLAKSINDKKQLGINPDDIELGAMLHDIGIVRTNAPGIGCHGGYPYICHGVLGADMLREAGAPEWVARIAERHTGAGLTPDDIRQQNLPLPVERCLVPESLLEKLICYADKFYSKNPSHLSRKKKIDDVRAEMAQHGADTLARFESLHTLFEV